MVKNGKEVQKKCEKVQEMVKKCAFLRFFVTPLRI